MGMHSVMHRSSHNFLVVAVVLVASVCASCSDSSSSVRDISKFRVDQVPTVIGQPLPLQWGKMFDYAMASATELDLDNPESLNQIEGLVRKIPWVDPRTVEAHLAMPDGVRLYYKSLIPALVIRQNGMATGLLSKEGRALPPGFSDDQLKLFLSINIPKGVELPAFGDMSSSGLLQEAVRIFPEVDQLKSLTKLNIVAIQQQADYRSSATAIVPPLTFVTADYLAWPQFKHIVMVELFTQALYNFCRCIFICEEVLSQRFIRGICPHQTRLSNVRKATNLSLYRALCSSCSFGA